MSPSVRAAVVVAGALALARTKDLGSWFAAAWLASQMAGDDELVGEVMVALRERIGGDLGAAVVMRGAPS